MSTIDTITAADFDTLRVSHLASALSRRGAAQVFSACAEGLEGVPAWDNADPFGSAYRAINCAEMDLGWPEACRRMLSTRDRDFRSPLGYEGAL